MMRARIIVLSLCAIAASYAFGQKMSKSHERWIERDVSALATRDEVRLFGSLSQERDRDQFQEIFWLRRDPNLGTPANEFKDAYEERIAIANDRLEGRTRPGAFTDMGQVFLLYGFPGSTTGGRAQSASLPEALPAGSRVEGSDTEAYAPSGGPAPARFQTWVYPADPALHLSKPLTLEFRAQPNFGYRLIDSEEVDEALESRRQALVAHADIGYETDVAGNLLPPAIPGDATRAGEILDTLLASASEATDVAFRAMPAFFRSSEGETYVPVLFEVETSGLNKAASGELDLTFFGAVTNDSGEVLSRFEERVWLNSTAPDGSALGKARFEVPLQLPPGDYEAHFGVLDETGDVHGSRVQSLFVRDFGSDDVHLSTVLVYRLASESEEPSGTPGNAFQFGRIKLDPAGTIPFGKDDAVGLFFYVYGASGTELTAKYSFYQGPEEKAQTRPQPLLASDGIAIGTDEVPLANFTPGDYRIRVEVHDTATGEVYQSSAFFTLEQ